MEKSNYPKNICLSDISCVLPDRNRLFWSNLKHCSEERAKFRQVISKESKRVRAKEYWENLGEVWRKEPGNRNFRIIRTLKINIFESTIKHDKVSLSQKFQPSISIIRTNAACTKFGVTKCRIAPPPFYLFPRSSLQ